MSMEEKTFEQERTVHEYLQREEGFLRAGYFPELEFYSYVKSGNVRRISELCSEPLHTKPGLGVLSDKPLQSMKYHFAITAALLARYCIEGGMELADAYGLSDVYIQKADRARRVEDISELHRDMCIDYTRRMKNLRKKTITSLPVVKAIDYIYENLHTRITLPVLAQHAEVSTGYLSREFKRETGETISGYIRRKKLETAGNMLIYSEFTTLEISEILAFPSQSYFTEVFRRELGVTPSKYREMNRFRNEIGKRTMDNQQNDKSVIKAI